MFDHIYIAFSKLFQENSVFPCADPQMKDCAENCGWKSKESYGCEGIIQTMPI